MGGAIVSAFATLAIYHSGCPSHQFLLAGSSSEVVALFPNLIPIAAATIAKNVPMPNITAPGINIANLSSPVDMDPMMRSGKPILNKVMPITNVIFHCFMNLDRA